MKACVGSSSEGKTVSRLAMFAAARGSSKLQDLLELIENQHARSNNALNIHYITSVLIQNFVVMKDLTYCRLIFEIRRVFVAIIHGLPARNAAVIREFISKELSFSSWRVLPTVAKI
jgi:hypothetical protein